MQSTARRAENCLERKKKTNESKLPRLFERGIFMWLALIVFYAFSLIIFSVVDCLLYCKSPYPERTYYGMWPGSGFVVFFKLRQKKLKEKK